MVWCATPSCRCSAVDYQYIFWEEREHYTEYGTGGEAETNELLIYLSAALARKVSFLLLPFSPLT